LQFPGRAEADAWRRSRTGDGRDGRRSADNGQTGLTGLLDAVVQTNLRTVEAMFQLTNPVRWIELQQRMAQDYMTVVMTANLALVRAMTNMLAEPVGVRSVQTVPVRRSQTRG
jgi:hypothetical protein